jgi:predicted PurR-regulated permease PerM
VTNRAFLRTLRGLYGLASLVVVIAALYLGSPILIPIVLAILLTFMLSPLMLALERRGVPRLPAAVAVVLGVLLVMVAMTLLVGQQMRSLMQDLPDHKDAIIAKLESLRSSTSESWLAEFTRTLNEIGRRVTQEEMETAKQPTVTLSPWYYLSAAVEPATHTLATIGLVLILAFFMLLRREDLRNRLIRLGGRRNVVVATTMVDDAGQRIGSFLIAQLAVNSTFGLIFGAALGLLGVPYPVLGGFLGGLMRYIPFLGVWIAAVAPVTLTVAILPGWWHVAAVLGVVLALELAFSQIVEPFVFGSSIGVSEVMMLISLIFWGWLWGVVGMILATPLTACLAVLGRHVPRLRFLDTLLGDEPPMTPRQAFYQRLLAKDSEEADKIVEAYRAVHDAPEVYEELFLPALVLAKKHRRSGELTADCEATFRERIKALLPAPPNPDAGAHLDNGRSEKKLIPVLGVPAGDENTEISLELFGRLLPRDLAHFEVCPSAVLAGELVARVREEGPAVVLLAVLPGDEVQARYLLKRLRAEAPEVKLLAGCWGSRGPSGRTRERLLDAGADMVGFRMTETEAQLAALAPAVRARVVANGAFNSNGTSAAPART